MGLTITDNTTYFTLTFSAANDQYRDYPKNSVLLDRNGDNFKLVNGGDRSTSLNEFSVDDVIDVDGGGAPASADALHTSLVGIIFA